MSRSWLYIAFGVSAALTILGAFAIIIAQGELASGKRTATITGEVVCLPHKKVWGLFGVETAECAIGLRAQDGRHYGFDNLHLDEKHNWLLNAQGSKELFDVSGIVRPVGDDNRYDVAGMIEVNSAARADGTTSIYEAYARHYNQLSGIVEEISRRTGGGYSMGIDDGCNDLSVITDGKSPCILIVLERDVPELSSAIPQELEGHAIHVVKQPSPPSIFTVPALTEDQAIDIMRTDLRDRVGDDVLVFIYARDARDPEIDENPLPLIYYRQDDNMAFRVNGTTHSIMGSCVPSLECFLNGKEDVLDSIAGRLFYLVDGSYSGEEKSSPAYYYIDAMNGNILWSYIGEDIYPELKE